MMPSATTESREAPLAPSDPPATQATETPLSGGGSGVLGAVGQPVIMPEQESRYSRRGTRRDSKEE